MKKKLTILAIMLIILFAPKAASAADFTVSSDTDLASLSLSAGDTVTVESNSDIKLYSSNASAAYDINIICEANVFLEIENINIQPGSGCALDFQGGSNTLTISGTNNLQSASSQPGVKAEGTTILNISGTGILTSRGGSHGAGIGGSENVGSVTNEADRISAGTINILSGTVNAYGGAYAAGIGGGEQGHGGNINISGGTIYAQGNTSGAGIGGGAVAKSGIINISGDAVITARGSTNGAGIGAGSLFAVEEINISGGTIKAYGGSNSAAIGGGLQSDGGNINISGGNIKAYAKYAAAAIGAGYYADCGEILITGGTISATYSSSGYGSGIGTGRYGLGGSVTIEGGDIYASGGRYGGAGIGGGYYDANVSITISGGETHGIGYRAAGIGSGRYSSSCPDITITGGLVIADTSYSGYNNIGASTTSGTCNVIISGDSALFIIDNQSSTIVTSTHSYYNDEDFTSGSAYGYSLPTYYTGRAYAWLPNIPVTYAAGEHGSLAVGDATEEDVLKGYSPKNAPGTLPDSCCYFAGWSDGTITSTDLADFIITEPTTLTAVFSPIEVTGITLDIYDAELILGDSDTSNNTVDLTETISPSDAANENVTWSSADTSIATVDSNGLVSAMSAGVTTVTVTTEDGSYSAECTITVRQRVTDVTLDKHGITYTKNVTDTLTCDVVPYDADDRTVSWYCDNPNVVTYTVLDDSTIQFTTIGSGVAHITVTTNDGGYTDTCIISVYNPDGGSNAKQADLSSQLIDSTDAGVSGYTFTLYSDPVSAITDLDGIVVYEDTPYDYHTLVIQNSSGVEIRRYDLTFTQGSNTGYTISGSDIYLTYTAHTTSIHLLFRLESPGDNVSVTKTVFTVENPSTGDNSTFWERLLEFFKRLFS